MVVGLAYECSRRELRITGLVLATALIYIFGLSWLILSTGMSGSAAMMAGMIPFLPGDVLKGAAAYLVASSLEHYPEWPAKR